MELVGYTLLEKNGVRYWADFYITDDTVSVQLSSGERRPVVTPPVTQPELGQIGVLLDGLKAQGYVEVKSVA